MTNMQVQPDFQICIVRSPNDRTKFMVVEVDKYRTSVKVLLDETTWEEASALALELNPEETA